MAFTKANRKDVIAKYGLDAVVQVGQHRLVYRFEAGDRRHLVRVYECMNCGTRAGVPSRLDAKVEAAIAQALGAMTCGSA